MAFSWPRGFDRIPSDGWTQQPVETLARGYDMVEHHGWYRNLDATVDDLRDSLRDGRLLIDYSGGTGILTERLLKAAPDHDAGTVIVDASPKFLRLALEKFRNESRVALRLLRFLKEQKRLEELDEIVPMKADVIVSTNAVHLYYDLDATLASWARTLKPGGVAFVQSGNIRSPYAAEGEWIIDETVDALHAAAVRIVRRDPRWAAYRAILDDPQRMARYDSLRRKYFLPVRPLMHYLDALSRAGLLVDGVRHRTIEARVDEWRDFLSVYHEGVLGWVGGAEKLEGRAAGEDAVADRLEIVSRALEEVFKGKPVFPCCWTYLTCRAEGRGAQPCSS